MREMEGLLLGFFGNFWNTNGVQTIGYGFKHLSKEKAKELFDLIAYNIDENRDYLKTKNDEYNIAFRFEDMDVLIWTTYPHAFKIRLFWNNFDSTWEATAYFKTKKRFFKI